MIRFSGVRPEKLQNPWVFDTTSCHIWPTQTCQNELKIDFRVVWPGVMSQKNFRKKIFSEKKITTSQSWGQKGWFFDDFVRIYQRNWLNSFGKSLQNHQKNWKKTTSGKIFFRWQKIFETKKFSHKNLSRTRTSSGENLSMIECVWTFQRLDQMPPHTGRKTSRTCTHSAEVNHMEI